MDTVREFIRSCWRLINPSNPTMPLHGDDQKLALECLNILLSSFAATGLKITVAKTAVLPVGIGKGSPSNLIVTGLSNYVPTPDIIGRLANLNDAWLELSGVTYPLQDISRNQYFESYKYEPLEGLPAFILVFQDIEVTRLQLYPAPSQSFDLHVRGKFELDEVAINDSLAFIPRYMRKFLKYAVAKDVAYETGRSEAWTQDLEDVLIKETDIIVAASEVNLSIDVPMDNMLNGHWRVRSGT